ncbi:MAG: sigma 54-interacting transcriptional regulator [Clostridiales bacterium]|nr:sigma 54-interacting transcriptional regulator [Clostridiales bacterium]MCF8021295.1 sigma 54-interacting transcriptional regulator [Clostridiales bacterium]
MDREKSLDKHLFDTILEGVQEGIVILNSQGIIIKCNEKLQNILNLLKEEIIGSKIENIMPGLKTDNRESISYKMQVLKKKVIVRKIIISQNNANFKILFVSENHLNYELENKYKEVKLLKETYENIINSIDEGIHVADKNENLRFINPAQEKLDDLKAKDVLGKHWLDIYSLDEKTSLVLNVLKEGKPIKNRYQNYVTHDGKYVSIVCSCLPLYSEGKIIGAAAITSDYVKFKRTAEKILNLNEEKLDKNNKQEGKEKYYSFNDIWGKNKKLLESIEWGKAAAKSESSVLIYGETGTGKEMFAQSIHKNSKRSKGPFLAINCAAIPESLLEGILFGTTKGVFTGAIDKEGQLEQVNGGTLLLDEINSMPLTLQSKLLRVIEEKKVIRLGGKKEISVDVRFISTCNIEPSEAIKKGQLRSDLFYRLAVIYLVIPPLRERLDDLELLIEYFISQFNNKINKNIKKVSLHVLEDLYNYYWHGNIRELKHCFECAMNLVSNDETIIKAEHIPKYLKIFSNDEVKINNENDNITTYNIDKKNNSILDEIKQQEKEKIVIALKRNYGNAAKAAADLGMSRQRLHYRLKKYNLK